jgi:alpha-glucosidase
LTAQAQADDPASTLSLYRQALRLRRSRPAEANLLWHDSPDDVVDFTGRGGIRCVVNLGGHPVPVPAEPLLASGPLVDGQLPPDTAAWY